MYGVVMVVLMGLGWCWTECGRCWCWEDLDLGRVMFEAAAGNARATVPAGCMRKVSFCGIDVVVDVVVVARGVLIFRSIEFGG